MNVFFDVDYTLIDGDGGLRPGVREAFTELKELGHDIYLWSGLGPRWETVEEGELADLVSDCFDKPLYRHRAMLRPLGIEVSPDYVVDDHPHLVDVFGGCVVTAYRSFDPEDRELDRVVAEIRGGGR